MVGVHLAVLAGHGEVNLIKTFQEINHLNPSVWTNKMVNSSNGPAAKLLAWSADRYLFNITKNR